MFDYWIVSSYGTYGPFSGNSSNSALATNIAGGTGYEILVQTGANTTGFVTGGTGLLYQSSAGSMPIITSSPYVTANANPYDASSQAANDLYVQNAVNLTMATSPFTITGGTISFNSLGSGSTLNYSVTSGAITTINSWMATGANYLVGDVITPQAGNYDAMIRVTAVNGSNQPTAGAILYGGTGYSAGTAVTGSAANSINFTFLLSGTLTSNATLIMAHGTYLTQSNQWIFANNTTGAYIVTVCVGGATDACAAGGRTVVVPQGTNNSASELLQTDGELNVDQAIGYLPGYAPLSGATFTGAVSAPSASFSGTVAAGTSVLGSSAASSVLTPFLMVGQNSSAFDGSIFTVRNITGASVFFDDFHDENSFTSTVTGGYATLDCDASINGSATMNHVVCGQDRDVINTPVNTLIGYDTDLIINAPVSYFYDFHAYDWTGTGSVGTRNVILIDPFGLGHTGYGIYDQSPGDYFAGNVQFGSTVEFPSGVMTITGTYTPGITGALGPLALTSTIGNVLINPDNALTATFTPAGLTMAANTNIVLSGTGAVTFSGGGLAHAIVFPDPNAGAVYTASQVLSTFFSPMAGTVPAGGAGTFNAVAATSVCNLGTAATASTTFTFADGGRVSAQ